MFSLIHSTFHINEILEDGHLRSLAKMKNKEIKSNYIYETTPYIFTLLVETENISNIIKKLGGMNNFFLFDTSLLLNRKFTLNYDWVAGPGTDSDTYDGNQLTEKELSFILQTYYNKLLEQRNKNKKINLKIPPHYYGEVIFTHQIDLKRYLRKIYYSVRPPISKYVYEKIQQIIKASQSYKKVEIVLYKKE